MIIEFDNYITLFSVTLLLSIINFKIINNSRYNLGFFDFLFYISILISLQQIVVFLLIDGMYKYILLLFFFTFYIGVLYGNKASFNLSNFKISISSTKSVYFISILIVGINGILVSYDTNGGFFFNSNYSQSLIFDSYRKFTGLKYLYFGANVLLIASSIKIYFEYRITKYLYIAFLVVIITSIMTHPSKVGFILLLFDFCIGIYYYQHKIPRQILYFLSVVLILPGFFSIYFYYDDKLIDFLLYRIIDNSGNLIIAFRYYGIDAFQNLDFFQPFIWYFDTFLSVFRFKEWNHTTYVNYMNDYLGIDYTSGYGKNPTFLFDSYFLFGYFGFILTFIYGFLISSIKNVKADFIILFFIIKLLIIGIQDSSNVHSIIIGLILILPFIYFISLFINGKVND